ncbi:MAG: tetratricopeptide repeat protein [Geminicoccaceae bacterium]
MDPNEAQVHVAAAVAAVWQGDLDAALASAERCIALQPSSTDGRRAKAAAQIYMGRPKEALATIEAYMRFDPVYPEIALQFQAEALFLVGDYPETERILRSRLERNPEAATAYELLAASLGLMGRTEEAAQAWAQVMRLLHPSPSSAAAASCRSATRPTSSAASRACAAPG